MLQSDKEDRHHELSSELVEVVYLLLNGGFTWYKQPAIEVNIGIYVASNDVYGHN